MRELMEDKLIKITSLATTFGLVVCSIYLFAYWSSFGINVLEYVTLSDFVKLGIYPVIVGVTFFVVGSIIGTILPPQKIDETQSQEEKHKAIGKINRYNTYVKLSVITIITGLTIYEYFQSDSQFWFFLGGLAAFSLIISIRDIKYLEPLIPNHAVRVCIVAVIVATPPIAFTTAKYNAQNILTGKSVKVINTKTFKEYGTEAFKNKGFLEGQDTLKFVGVAGEYFFLVTMDNSVTYAVKYSDLHFLELRPYAIP
jgi:hypothetical protein